MHEKPLFYWKSSNYSRFLGHCSKPLFFSASHNPHKCHQNGRICNEEHISYCKTSSLWQFSHAVCVCLSVQLWQIRDFSTICHTCSLCSFGNHLLKGCKILAVYFNWEDYIIKATDCVLNEHNMANNITEVLNRSLCPNALWSC